MKIIRFTGTRPDGVKIDFTPEDIDKAEIQTFNSIETVAVMSPKELKEMYPEFYQN